MTCVTHMCCLRGKDGDPSLHSLWSMASGENIRQIEVGGPCALTMLITHGPAHHEGALHFQAAPWAGG